MTTAKNDVADRQLLVLCEGLINKYSTEKIFPVKMELRRENVRWRV
jgi:hypothetical protein